MSHLPDQTQGVTIGKTKTKIKGILKEEQKDYWRSKVAPLVFQGDFLKLVELEKGDLTWRSLIFNLPKGVLSFITRAAINALPTADNLSRWGKRLNTRCTLCGNHETLLHILNNCKSALEQGRYNYRHDSILQYLVSFIGKVKPDKVICHADLPGHDINGGTVPSDLTPTSERPDIVLVNQSSKSVVIGELTVPFESNIDSAHNRKSEKYASLVLDIENQGYSCELICFEVGSRGLVTKENKRQVTKLFKFVSDTRRIREHIRTISKIAILTSFAIYNARSEPSWTKPAYLQPANGRFLVYLTSSMYTHIHKHPYEYTHPYPHINTHTHTHI